MLVQHNPEKFKEILEEADTSSEDEVEDEEAENEEGESKT